MGEHKIDWWLGLVRIAECKMIFWGINIDYDWKVSFQA